IDQSSESAKFISTGFIWLDLAISIALISIQAVYLNIIVNEYKLLDNNSHLASLMFVLLNSAFLLLFSLNQVVIANTFILLGIHQLLRIYDSKGSFALSFNAGFLISIATTIYFPNAIFLLLFWVGIIYMITPKWRDFAITLIGFSVPIIYVVSYSFVFDNLNVLELNSSQTSVYNMNWSILGSIDKALFFIILGILILALLSVISNMSKGVLRTRKMLVVIILMGLFGLGTIILNKADYLATFVVLTIPLSILIANFFQGIKKQWLAELLFLCLLTVIVVNYFS
ncbi:DUF6427 family protein, partial [Vicingaceae bacterium]|nr:DUF6427 family protein [Vicingaceae bacterium]